MPYRKDKLTNNNYYHIYNRGVNRSNIFLEEKNYYFFLNSIKKYLLGCLDVIAYCLMPNHFHFLVIVSNEEVIEESFKKFFISYSKSINKLYKRSGPLYEGRYKTKLVSDNNYLLHLSRYIHLNPVRANLVMKPEQWKFSSYKFYINGKKTYFVNNRIILNQIVDYKKFVENYQPNDRELIADLLFS